MNNNFIESIDTFKVNFGGDNSVDAELFTKTMNNTISLVKASANVIDPSCFLRLEIKANKEGSFETIIDAVANASETIFTKDNAQLAFYIVGGFWAFLQIKEHLGGKRAKKINRESEKTEIVNQDNVTLSVERNDIAESFFSNAKIDNSIINIFTDLQSSKKPSFSVKIKQWSSIIKIMMS